MEKIIVTGAGSGIGRALAHTLAKTGRQVFAIGRSLAALEETKDRYPNLIQPIAADITEVEGRFAITDRLKNIGVGNCLINNAGIAAPRTLHNVSQPELERHMQVNFIAPTLLTG